MISLAASLAWVGETSWHNQLEADSQSVLYPNSPELTTLFVTTRTIERGIRAQGGEDFVLIVNGRVPGEYFYYDLDTHEIETFCDRGDLACTES